MHSFCVSKRGAAPRPRSPSRCVFVAVLVLAPSLSLGCASPTPPYAPPPGHPANPDSAEAPRSIATDFGERPEPSHDDPGVGDLYVCPMHPDVRAREPGRCPKCGMKLVKSKPREPAEERR